MAEASEAATCGVCGKTSRSYAGLTQHASVYHPGVAHEVWDPTWIRKRPLNPKLQVTPIRSDVPRARPSYLSVEEREQNSAASDALAKLPWTHYPQSPESCERAATCLAFAMDAAPSDVKDYLADQYTYLLALADLLRAKAA